MRISLRSVLSAGGVAALVVAPLVATYYLWSRPIEVSVAPVETDIPVQVFGLGTVGARVQSSVGFKVSGVLVSLKADQGDRVQTGDILAQLDARDMEAQLAIATAGVAQARANVEKAGADVASASATLDNNKAISSRRAGLAKSGYASAETAQTTEAAVRVAEAVLASAVSGVSVAESALKSAEAQQMYQQAVLANYTLRAPYDAWIVSRNLELGSAANPGQPVFTLVAAHTVWVLGYVDERLAGNLAVGQPVKIVLRSNPATVFPGRVERIEIQSDAVNEERLVDVAFEKIPDAIHLAEQAEVMITTAIEPRAVLVQPAAVTDPKNNRGGVWTVENGRLARREVTFGRQLLDGRLPIIAGLPDGAVVVAEPKSGLRVGRAASIAEAGQP